MHHTLIGFGVSTILGSCAAPRTAGETVQATVIQTILIG